MGYIRHEAVLVTINDFDKRGRKALNAFLATLPAGDDSYENYRQYFVGPVEGINGYLTYACLPDGSKEGWDPSDAMDGYRAKFIATAKRAKYPTIVHLQYGGDDHETIVLFTTDESIKVDPAAAALPSGTE